MFGLFKNKTISAEQEPDWLPQMQENQQRFFDFIEKIEERMFELTAAAVPELTTMKQEADENSMEFHRMKAGIDGQLSTIRKKVYDVHDDKILGLMHEIKNAYELTSKESSLLYAFRDDCRERFTQFEEKMQKCSEEIAQTDVEDFEIAYQKILAEYDNLKDKFNCTQCGNPLSIDRIFFINVHINCSACQTQNTFEPSSQARMLQHFAQDLAHQRASDLYKKFKEEADKERTLYHEIHPIKLKLNFEKNEAIIAELEAQKMDLEQKRLASIENTPIYHKEYLVKKFTEWKNIVPDLADQLEKRLQQEIAAID